MHNVSVAVERNPDEATRRTVLVGLSDENVQRTGDGTFGSVFVAARDLSSTLIGGVIGEAYWGWVNFTTVWVDPSHRRKGLATRMLTVEWATPKPISTPFRFNARTCTYALATRSLENSRTSPRAARGCSCARHSGCMVPAIHRRTSRALRDPSPGLLSEPEGGFTQSPLERRTSSGHTCICRRLLRGYPLR